MEKKWIDEMFLLRSIACLCLVFRNSFNRTFPESSLLGNFLELMLTFGTPAFIFISEMILAHSSRDRADSHFWTKRIQYILAPYFLFGALYALMKSAQIWVESKEVSLGTLVSFLWRHWLLGDYHGYFILIVFQFYALHKYMTRLDRAYSPISILTVSMIINMVYLGFFNFVPSPDSAVLHYVWSKFYWIPFPGWAFYFVLAYYCGSRYEQFKTLIAKHGRWSWAAVTVSGLLCFIMLHQEWIRSVSSKRVDMVIFTVSVIFLVCYIMVRVGKISPVFISISRYSFGIYLLHPMFLAVMFVPLQMFPSFRSNWFTLAVLFAGSIGCSVVTTYILNKTKWGPYIVGKIGTHDVNRKRPASTSLAKKIGVS
ncbi:acyltransferase family protein [Paenibacillus sp. GYB003]|uniref:acyltransferase family protein n=1 Tax=Paenibacillus sp. GYB003 TaxID=2994392 RepID=UPI002F96A571